MPCSAYQLKTPSMPEPLQAEAEQDDDQVRCQPRVEELSRGAVDVGCVSDQTAGFARVDACDAACVCASAREGIPARPPRKLPPTMFKALCASSLALPAVWASSDACQQIAPTERVDCQKKLGLADRADLLPWEASSQAGK